MILRRNFLPHILPDISATLFLSVCVAITFWFELFVVVPEFHAPGSLAYNLTFAAAVFLLLNVKGNMLAVMLIDTSIKGRILTPPEDPEQKKQWRLCSVCETMAPPRSWHCNTCKTCILKRDHHCLFTGCCIGHHNHRYFMMLVLFLFIGSTYASFYNHYFIWYHHAKMYKSYWTVLKLVMPLFMLTLDTTSGNFYLAIFELNLLAIAISGMLLIYHGKIILKGGVVHERRKPMYNLGWKQNLKIVFGERWYLVWILPFIESKLPHDGIHWEKVGSNSAKNR